MTGAPDPEAARARLAVAQGELIAALVTGRPAPAGFDASRLRVQTAALVAKRRNGVTRVRPDLSQALGPRFPALFDAYATAHPQPAQGGSAADGRAFADHLAAHGHLPERAVCPPHLNRLRRLAARLSFRRRPGQE